MEHREVVVSEPRGASPLPDPVRFARRSSELSAELIENAEGVRALQADYERLERASGNTLPFALHEWHLTWCEQLLNRHSQREERLQLIVLRNRSGD